MKKRKSILEDINMTWAKVFIFAIITGVYTGIINQVPLTNGTSFRDIAVSPEVWVLFALFVVCNCKNPWEAGIKCFVFFLISQPLVYLVEIPLYGEFAWKYYKYWFIITLFTFPGGFLAYFVKKQNIIGTLIMSVANCLMIFIGMEYAVKLAVAFPSHLLTVIYCFIFPILFIFIFQKKKQMRIVGLTIIAVALISAYIFNFGVFGKKVLKSQISLPLPENQTWTCTFEDDSYGEVDIVLDNEVTVTMSKIGSTRLICTGSDGKEIIYTLTNNTDGVISFDEEE